MWAKEVASSHVQRWFSTMDRSWEQPTSTLSAKWAPCGAEVQELSRDHPPSQSDGQIPSLLHHVKITGNPILEGVSWDFATEMDLPLRSGLPCCPSLWIHCWHGSFPPETKLSTVYIHFISVYITASIFLYSKGPFMVKKIYIWFPINNQSYHVLEGKKLLEGNVCRKVQLRASAVFFFFLINLPYFCTHTTTNWEGFLSTQEPQTLSLLGHAVEMGWAFQSYLQDSVGQA